MLNHPDYIQEVLATKSNQFGKSPRWEWTRRLLGNGILTSEGEFWQRQRRLIQPAFQRERIFAYGQVMVDYTQQLLNSWEDGETRDVYADMLALTLEIIAKSLFQVDEKEAVEVIGKALKNSIEYFEAPSNNLFLFLLPDWFPTSKNLNYLKAVQSLDNVIYTTLNQRRASGQDKGDLLSMLLQIQDEDGIKMSDKQIRDEVIGMLIAGRESTALVLCWTWYLLSQHPEVESKLLEELQTILGGQALTIADLPQLRYTERVVMEVMRLYPPVATVGRTALQNCEVAGYPVRAGDTIMMSQWVMHHDPRYFDNPEAFNPDCWEGDLIKRLPAFAYFPFSGGPMICIGKSFAIMELVLLLATIAQQFRLKLVPDQKVTLCNPFLVRPKNRIKMLLNKR
ncbi:cytochrome P450 [Nostoc sp.]|uniref:cytochrome P450 n=1 Tax=Nostoc sp. TaxID=1180 RepID=UPI002FF46D49